MRTRRELLALGLAAAAGTNLIPGEVSAQAYPDRPIRLIVPFPPGGSFDAVGRPWADKMKSLLGTVVVENQGGGGSSLGAATVARSAPDGYTLLLGGSGAMTFNPAAATKPLYDPIADFEPIALLVRIAWSLVVHPSVPVRTLAELIDYTRANPGKLSYGTAGVGSGNHLTGELFKSLTGLADLVHVPYRGAGPAMADLVSGQIPMGIPSVTAQVLELHRTGKVRVLAIPSRARLVAAQDIPTAVEAGVPGMVAEGFIGLFAPRGTPRPVIDRIAEATRTAMADVELQKLFIAAGFEPFPESSPELGRQLVIEELARWKPVIGKIGLKLD